MVYFINIIVTITTLVLLSLLAPENI